MMKPYFSIFVNGLKKRKYLIVLMGIALVFFLLSIWKDERLLIDRAVFGRIEIIQRLYNGNNAKDAVQLSRNLEIDYPEHYASHWMLGSMLILYAKEQETTTTEGESQIKEGLNELEISLELYDNYSQIKNEEIKYNLIYAQVLEENNRLEKSLTHFKKHFDGNKNIVLTDPYLRKFVFSYGDVLGKMGRNVDAIKKYKELFDANGREPRLIQGYMKLLSDYDGLQGALDIANDYEHYAGFNIRVAFGKCQALFDHKVFDQAKPCLESLNKKITKNEDVEFSEDSLKMLEVIEKERAMGSVIKS